MLLRDALRRFGAGIALAIVPFAWVWRSFPPWELRASLWALEGAHAYAAVVVLPLVWAVLTTPVVRLLLRSARLEYWRQFPIARVQWVFLHAVHLASIDAPGIAIAVYLFAPLHDRVTIAGATLLVLLVALAAQLLLAATRVRLRLVSPRLRTIVGALARLYVVTVIRRERSSAGLALGIQVVGIAYAIIGVAHVVDDEPAAAWSLVAGVALFGSLAAGWLVLVAQRAVDRDRWYLDALPGTTTSTELAARVLAGCMFAAPTIVGLAIAAAPVGFLRAALVGLVAAAWASAAFARIGARAEACARLHDPQQNAGLVLVAYGIAAITVVGALALPFLLALELVLAHRALGRATTSRTRFETTNREDDHG